MTLADVAGLLGLSWDTVKDIVKPYLKKAVKSTRFKGLKHLAIDEIYVGKKRKFYTLVIDLDTGRIVWVGGGWGRPRYGVEWTHTGPQRQWIGWLTRV